MPRVKSWQPPAIIFVVLALAVGGFALGGPGTGISILGLSLVGLVVLAILAAPDNPIGRSPHPESARRILIVATVPIEDPATIEKVAAEVDLGGLRDEAEIRVLTLAHNTFLERWATDLKRARERAARDLVISVASLELAGLPAGARVGDEDLTLAIEDELAGFDATEVHLVTVPGELESDLLDDLHERVRPPIHLITVSRPGSPPLGLD